MGVLIKNAWLALKKNGKIVEPCITQIVLTISIE